MNDKMFWRRFSELAEEAKKRRIITSTIKYKKVYLLKIIRSKNEQENDHVAVTSLLPHYDEFTILKEHVLKNNELLPPFFNETKPTIPELIKRLDMVAEYDYQRAIKAYRKHLTFLALKKWLNETEKKDEAMLI